uniref:Uncharacterized protein n=1 Tax=Glossina palpalis gambiensis TaxID=67801 RepID=A0A1B0AN67_9MUSC
MSSDLTAGPLLNSKGIDKTQQTNTTQNFAATTITDNDNSKIEVIVLSKSDKTLMKAINTKDDTLRKRASLVIVPQKDLESPNLEETRSLRMSDSEIVNENCKEIIEDCKTIEKLSVKLLNSSICSNHSSTDEEDMEERKAALQPDNGNNIVRNRNSIASVDSCVSRSSSSTSEITTSGDDVALDDYQDLENSNAIDELEAERKNCISNASSCIDDYSLREKLHNFVNAKLDGSCDASSSTDVDEGNIMDGEMESSVKSRSLPSCDTLLSPQEAPMGRRYGEVSQFMSNKRVGIGDGSSADGCSGSGSGGKTNSSFNASPNNGNVNASAASRSAGMVSSINPPATTSVIMPHDNASDQFQSLDANDSSCCGDGQFEDDMQALLPKCQRLSRDELSQIRR